MAFGLRKAKVLAISVRAINFQDFRPICDPDPPMLQTDRRTDRQTTCDRKNDTMKLQYMTLFYFMHCGQLTQQSQRSRLTLHIMS